MSKSNEENSASMDDILTSIRQIIHEDTKAALKTPPPSETSVLELKDVVEDKTENLNRASEKITDIADHSTSHPPHSDYRDPTKVEHTHPSARTTTRVQSNTQLKESIAQTEELSEGFRAFLDESLKNIVHDHLKRWSEDHIPKMADTILREQIRLVFRARASKKS